MKSCSVCLSVWACAVECPLGSSMLSYVTEFSSYILFDLYVCKYKGVCKCMDWHCVQVCTHVYAYGWGDLMSPQVCTHVCMRVEVEPRACLWIPSLLLSVNPEFTNMAVLATGFAPGMSYLYVPSSGITRDHHAHMMSEGLLRTRILVLCFTCLLYHLRHFCSGQSQEGRNAVHSLGWVWVHMYCI